MSPETTASAHSSAASTCGYSDADLPVLLSIRSTSAELGEALRLARFGFSALDPAPGTRRHAELGGVADHVGHGLVGDADQWVLNGVAVGRPDHQAAGQLILLSHFGGRPLGLNP